MLTYLLLFLVFWGIPLYFLYREIRFAIRTRRCTEEMQGTVVGLTECWMFDSRSRSSFKPQITYTYGGKQYTALTFHSFNYDEYAARHTVSIYIDPAHPERFVTYTEKQRRSMYIVISVVCTAVIALVLAALWSRNLL